MSTSHRRPGRHFLQIPGPTPVPERILAAMARQVLDHRGLEFGELGRRVLGGIKGLFKTQGHVIIYPSSGSGAWEAGLTNTLSPGDKVLMCETGQFAVLWEAMARRLGLETEVISTDWRTGADANAIEKKLREDTNKKIKAVCVVHNETSTGCLTRLDEVRKAIDAAGHPALLMADAISYRRDGIGFAERHDAAAGPVVHRDQRQGVGSFEDSPAQKVLLRVGRDAVGERHGLFPLHSGDEPALRSRRGDRYDQRGRLGERLRPSPPLG